MGGLLATEDGPWSSDVLTNLYTARMKTGLVLQQPTGTWTNGFTYDAAHRLGTVSSPAGTFSYTYRDAQPSTLIKKLSLPNTSYITNTYDSVARLTGTYLDNSSSTILDKSEYLYNVGNQRIRLTRTDGSYYTNNYDNIGQLKVADSTVASEDRGYLYDAAWNLNTRTNNGTTTAFNVDVKNQLSSVGGSGCTYDSNGNLIVSQPNAVTCSYDAENQLISAETASWWRTEWVYDGRSRLRIRREYGWMSGYILTNEVHYVYDGMRVIQERSSANTPTVSYTRGNDLSGSLEGVGGIGGLLARSHGYSSGNWTTHNHYHADGNGNITYMVDASQAMAATYRYDPFGNTISSSGTLASANLYRFSSKENQGNSGLYYYGYRFYDPNLQRWPNRDPIGEPGFETLRDGAADVFGAGPNLYTFVGNNAVGRMDPLGLKIYYCTVPTSSFPTLGIGRHAYLWDDRPGLTDKQRECGQESSCGSNSKGNSSGNTGPGGSKPMASGAICLEVPGSGGNEAAVMKDCRKYANTGIWFPGINDCHNKVKRCLNRNGLTPPDNPRFTPTPPNPNWSYDPSTGYPFPLN